jgi:hypothetical protein
MKTKAEIAELLRLIKLGREFPDDEVIENYVVSAIDNLRDAFDESDMAMMEHVVNLIPDDAIAAMKLDATPWFKVKP